MAIGTVARFDSRRGYGFVVPDDGGEDVFVHQNNIEMDGFRFLQKGERVSYEIEMGDKGTKAVQVALLEPRQERQQRSYEDRDSYRDRSPRRSSGPRGGGRGDSEQAQRLERQLDRILRKQERLITLLVAKDILTPGEIDNLPTDDDVDDEVLVDDDEVLVEEAELVAGITEHDE